jgi:hypothetical protein
MFSPRSVTSEGTQSAKALLDEHEAIKLSETFQAFQDQAVEHFKGAVMLLTRGAGSTIRIGNADVLFASHIISVLQGQCLIPGDGARNASTAP